MGRAGSQFHPEGRALNHQRIVKIIIPALVSSWKQAYFLVSMTTHSKLWGEALRAAVSPWREELGKSDRERLDALVGLSVREDIRLSDCLTALFPNVDTQKAQTALTSFRKRLNDAATEEGRPNLGLRFEVDTKKKNPPTERHCWFTGTDPAMAQAERYSQQLTADIQDKPLIHSKGIATTGTALASGKKVVRLFVSYAHEDKTHFEAIIKQLRIRFASSKKYELQSWTDQDILVGEGWRDRIQKAIDECHFGLLLLSPAFLASKFIGEHELPHFVGSSNDPRLKPVLPVGVVPVSFERQDLKGLQEQQIFRSRSVQIEARFFSELTGSSKKQEFIQQLYVAIEKRLDAFFAPSPGPGAPSPPGGKELSTADALADQLPLPEDTRHFQRLRAKLVNLGALERLDRSSHESTSLEQASDALAELQAWATNPKAPPFFALLGEYGIGKTTTLKQLTRLLLKERQSTPGLPLPIYVDLRDYIGESRDSIPTIEQLLASVIQRSWKLRDRSLTPQDLLRLIREEGALVIFDGLDEKIVHLPPGRAREFIRTLWAALPDATSPASPGIRRGKLLISCRAHYFRDIWDQNSMLIGEDREGLERQRFPALCLLPFTEPQIRAYLKSLLGNELGANRAFEVIASIHNLRELAQRPYLLYLISGQLGALEDLRARGEQVNAARLYELVVRSWLSRDDGKHQIDPAHKRRLMEDLAAALWREDRKQWDADRLEDWLDDVLTASPTLTSIYGHKDRTVLKEDLRTATFVLRGTTDEKHFRFAHTSLQEYFLAAYLVHALSEGRLDRWDLPMVSRETLDFLGEMLALEPHPTALRALESLLEGKSPRAAVLAFAYWLRALARGYPAPSPTRVKLAGANLEGWHIRGHGPTQLLDLRGVDLSGARLNRTRVNFVDISDADLTGSQARQALFMNVSALRLKAPGSDWCGLKWREGSLVSADLRGTQIDGCQWIRVGLAEAQLPDGWEHLATSIDGRQLKPSFQEGVSTLSVILGHSAPVTACAWSPDGQRILSGSEDASLKVWDAASGSCLLTLSGHSDSVTACAWSPDSQRILSGSSDASLKVWDAASGSCLLTLSGHSAPVNACAWSPDGQRILSGSEDDSLKVWDAASGSCLLTLSGHSAPVYACAWSPDGQRILSGSEDDSLKVWDAASGSCLLTLSGHSAPVTACAWSPDSQRILSGSFDDSLKVWDAASGSCLLTLSGHSDSVTACAWSPDSQRILSGSSDASLKVWDAASGSCLLTLSGHSVPVYACAWSPDGQRILSGSGDASLKVWDAASGSCLLTLSGHSAPVNACAWSPDGQRILSGSSNASLKVRDAASGFYLLTLSGHSAPVTACAWSPDGQRILSGSEDDSLKVWDAASGSCLLTLSGHSAPVTACAWSPDSQRILSGSFDDSLKVWDAASGSCLLTLSGHSDSVTACAWSPDSQRILSGSSDASLKVWDAASGSCLLTLSGHSAPVNACAWSPDSQRILSGSEDDSLKVWDAASGSCLLTLSGHSVPVYACAWSPDGQRILSGSSDASLKVWDAASGSCLLTLSGHSAPVNACAWSPDSQHILSGSSDASLKVWNAASGLCLWSGQILPEWQFASIDIRSGRILHASAEAWRWLGWSWTDPATGRLRLLPAEAMGPLPV
ncbi:TIR domain-containing protein [Cystobacter fuscus]|uniref:WD40 domain-containing protein n=1 Tax=Cystobacter fuscus TaxID=43 RepID=UPI002B29F260|nr:TIR domain-containing protein [Cystobacter fuscus]